MGDANEYLKLQEIADKYRVNQMTVRRWIKAGHLPAMKVGKQYRIKQSDLAAFLRDGDVEPMAREYCLEHLAQEPQAEEPAPIRLAKALAWGKDAPSFGPNPQPEERKA